MHESCAISTREPEFGGGQAWTLINIQRKGGYYTHDERSHLNHPPDAPRQGIAAMAVSSLFPTTNAQEITMAATEPFWPDNARLAVSFSLMFEAGGQPISGAGGVIPDPIENGLPDLPTNAFFDYGVNEGIPRILDLFDKHQIKLSSFMIGHAVDKAPDLAREIVKRGHEAAAHGRSWENSYALSPDAERRFIADGVESIERV